MDKKEKIEQIAKIMELPCFDRHPVLPFAICQFGTGVFLPFALLLNADNPAEATIAAYTKMRDCALVGMNEVITALEAIQRGEEPAELKPVEHLTFDCPNLRGH